MIALIQRVSEASVEVGGEVTGAIGKGVLILLGVHQDDTGQEIFPDEAGLMNRSVTDVGGEALVVSQFTLYGNTAKGNRPSFTDAARPEKAEAFYEQFVQALSAQMGKPAATGAFGAKMDVRLVNDGPVTLWVERKPGA